MIKLLFSLFCFSSLGADLAEQSTIEIRGALFLPASGTFERKYGDAGSSIELEINNPYLANWYCYPLATFVNFNWLYKKNGSHTSFHNLGLSIGIKRVYCMPADASAYFGLGFLVSGAYGERKCKSGPGFSPGVVFKSGYNIPLSRFIFVDVFADYYLQPWVSKLHVGLWGGRLGVGLGTCF